jgi:hypothetical protein
MKRIAIAVPLVTAGIILSACAVNSTAPAAHSAAPVAASPVAVAPLAPAAPAFSVQTTLISDIANNAQAKAIVEATLPKLVGHYDRVGSMTLAQLAPRSNGYIDDAKLQQIQAAFDKMK